jgi:tetratricopeptide (TPR) repeat protein
LGNREHLSHLLIAPIPYHHLQQGDLDAAGAAAEEGTEMAAKIGSLYSEAQGWWMLGYIAQMRGDYERSVRFYERALETGRASGIPFMAVWMLGSLGAVYIDISEKFYEKAVEYHSQALPMMEHPAGMAVGAATWGDMGFCTLAVRNFERADEYFQKGLNVPTMLMYQERPRLLVGAALVALARNQPDEAARYTQQAREFTEDRQMRWLYPLVALTEASVSAARGESDRALEHFARAEELALQMQMRPIVWQARAGAAQALDTLGRSGEADAERRAARSLIAEIADLFQDQGLRASFMESASRKI